MDSVVVSNFLLVRVVLFLWMVSGCPLSVFVVVGTSEMHPPVSHYSICILTVKRILLRALRSSGTAVFVVCLSLAGGFPAAASHFIVLCLVFDRRSASGLTA